MDSDLNDRANAQNYENMKQYEKYKISKSGKEKNEIINKAFEAKPKEAYPENVVEEMNNLKINEKEDNIHPIGSLSYRGTKYAGDYDFFEKIMMDTKENTIIFFIKNLQRMVKKYITLKNHYYGEIKCGVDKRFDINIGVCQNGVYYVNSGLKENIINLYKSKLISKEEYNFIMKVLNKNGQIQIDYEKINKILREHRVLRWNYNEIIEGKKKIPNGYKYLEDAVQDIEKINIETLAIINNKISDVSNFFYLTYTNNKKEYAINFNQSYIDDPKSFEQGLLESINSLLYSQMDYNPLKSIKRFFSLARNTGDMNLRKILQPFMNGETMELGKIKSELITINKILLKHGNKVSQNTVISHLDDIKFRMSTILQLDEKIIIEFDNKIIDIDKKYTPKKIIDFTNELSHSLIPILNENAINFLKTNLLYPTPQQYTPKNPQYRII
jgi:hypothetical protein